MSFRLFLTYFDGKDTVPLRRMSQHVDMDSAQLHGRRTYRQVRAGWYPDRPFGVCVLDAEGSNLWECRPDADYLGLKGSCAPPGP